MNGDQSFKTVIEALCYNQENYFARGENYELQMNF
jgi:hypothetical protein